MFQEGADNGVGQYNDCNARRNGEQSNPAHARCGPLCESFFVASSNTTDKFWHKSRCDGDGEEAMRKHKKGKRFAVCVLITAARLGQVFDNDQRYLICDDVSECP